MQIRILFLSLLTLTLCAQAHAGEVTQLTRQGLMRAFPTTGPVPEGVRTTRIAQSDNILKITHDKFRAQIKNLEKADLSANFNIFDSNKQEYEVSIKLSPMGMPTANVIEVINKLPALCFFKWDSEMKSYKLDMKFLPKAAFKLRKDGKIFYQNGTTTPTMVEIILTPLGTEAAPRAPMDSRAARVHLMQKAAE